MSYRSEKLTHLINYFCALSLRQSDGYQVTIGYNTDTLRSQNCIPIPPGLGLHGRKLKNLITLYDELLQYQHDLVFKRRWNFYVPKKYNI